MKLFFKVLCVFGIFSLCTAQELQLKIVGNDSVETNLINFIGYLKTFENFEDLQTEVDAFKNKLYQLGYIEMQILEISQKPPLTLIKTALGPKYESIRLYADKTLFEFLELEGVKNLKSNPYYLIEFAELESLLNSLTKFLSAKSYPFASVTLKAITPIGKSKLKADLVVETKQARQLQSVKIKGYEKFPRSFIKHFLNIKTNTPFDLKVHSI